MAPGCRSEYVSYANEGKTGVPLLADCGLLLTYFQSPSGAKRMCGLHNGVLREEEESSKLKTVFVMQIQIMLEQVHMCYSHMAAHELFYLKRKLRALSHTSL